jgi:hypothetical protein
VAWHRHQVAGARPQWVVNEQQDVIVGVLSFALAIFVIIFAFASYSGWSAKQYTIELRAAK